MEIGLPHMLLSVSLRDLPPRFSSSVNPPPYVFNHGLLMLLLETVAVRVLVQQEKKGKEEDPDRVQHVNCDRGSDIEFDELSGETRVGNRVLNDEDDNMFGEFMDRWIYNRVVGLTTGNALYVMKAGVLTTLIRIPFFIPGSAQFAYDNRFLGGIIMTQLTSARFRGDTTFGFLTLIFSTFLGGGVGLCGCTSDEDFDFDFLCVTTVLVINFLESKWPEERYHTLFNLQMQISYSLSHLLSVIEHLEPA
ncbi:hypothetical protein LENED_004083 [Lentinula edodes]|uniref:Uncharacterized protein n=1 Tax=Lentinula edodes TaxID=5353 RepID=A0A1Q3E593_LENED|nr:hypothetical protein LENED_004083 [Lentinula edodes]